MILEKGSIYCRENNLNFIRVAAATSVTFGHSFAMTHGSPYEFIPGINSAGFGFYAVAIFFGLSGFLITQSYFRNSNWIIYLKARLLRLVPGYLFANFVTALLIIFLVKSDWTLMFSKEFFIHIAGGTFKERYSFPDIFSNLHYNSTNGSMWTLTYEFRMYVLVLILGLLGILRRKFVFLGLFTFLFIVAGLQIESLFQFLFNTLFKIKWHDATYLALPLSFGLGVLGFLFKDKMRLFFLPSVLILVGSLLTDIWLLKCVSWIYFIFCFAYIPKLYIKKLNFKNDISYGVYILSWPIQQCVLHLKLTDNPFELFAVSMAFIIPLSFISWKLVEEPCLKLKNYDFFFRLAKKK